MSKKLELMGVPVTVGKAKDGKPAQLSITRGDLNTLKDKAGLDKEVRKRIEDFENTLLTESVDVLSDHVLDTKNELGAVLKIGTGASRTDVVLKPKTKSRNPSTGEESTIYGQVQVRKKGVVPKALKEGVVADIAAKMEKAFK